MVVRDTEIERVARELVVEHGSRAAWVAAERLNEMIDCGNIRGRDVWACVVHAIHEQQGMSPWTASAPDTHRLAPRLEVTA